MEQALKKVKSWLRKENRFFTKNLGCGEDTFTNGEVLAAHASMAVGLPVIFIVTSFIENL